MSAYNRTSYGEDIGVRAVTDARLQPLGYQQITATGAAIGLTAPAGTRIAWIDVEAQNVRWRDDGVAPTAAMGMRMLANTRYSYAGDMMAIKFIAEVAGAIVNVAYYG